MSLGPGVSFRILREDGIVGNGTSGGFTINQTLVEASNIGITAPDTAPDFAGGTQMLYIQDTSQAPTGTPTGGGLLYVESGTLKFVSDLGVVTILAAQG